jgi:sterol desaturase/sphingolipid hydroxylase (fatty acid hydroxylase superfamily)
MPKNYISNSEESTRMFKSKWLEPLSKVPFFVPIIIFVPIIFFFIYQDFHSFSSSIVRFISFFVLGLLIWTFSEYFLHRFVFHFTPKGKIMERIHFIFHGVHHDYPNDKLRLVMPPSVSIPLAALFLWGFNFLFNSQELYAFFPGFITGYITYDIGHYSLHHFNFKSGWMKKVKQHHMLHHYSDAKKGFGVTSPLWDKILSSDFPSKKEKTK